VSPYKIGCGKRKLFLFFLYIKAWGLPAYFAQFRRVLGGSSTKVEHGPVDSGDFLESDAVYSDAK
jgi:hypothetical protein